MTTNRLLLWVLAAANLQCYSPNLIAQETIGERFRKVLAETDSWCKQYKMGPYLDSQDPEYRSKRRGTDCNILRLQPRDWRTVKMVKLDSQPYPVPEHWLATPEGRFAHSIKLPPPHDNPKDVYRSGMSGGEYFQTLCRAEAGDFVFKSVENVDGIIRMRLPEIATDDMLRHLFATEGTTGMSLWHLTTENDDIGGVLVQPVHGRYRFVEARAFARTQKKDGFPFRRYVRDPSRATGSAVNYLPNGGTRMVPNEVVDEGIERPTARYGFTWRGVTRPNDREMGIAGGELIIFDGQTNEILGVRRVFRATGVGKQGAWWLTGGNCSKELATLPTNFIYRVLKPIE